MRNRLSGKVAVVVGGATGFGLACVERFAAEGAKVVVAGRRGDRAGAAAEANGGWGMTCDVVDHDQVAALAAAVMDREGRIDAAINFAGFQQNTPIAELTPEVLEPMVQVQLHGALYFVRHMATAMAAGDGGSLITVSSTTAHNPAVGLVAYAASKAGLEYATKIAAVEYGPHGIRVNCIAPHLIETEMTREIFEVPLVVEAVRMQTPLGRMGHVDDIANLALFLASDESAFISGQVILVDGANSCQKLPAAFDYELLAAARPELLG
ncbi:MAG: SDR family oxidoreductase [Acidimicrobiia bacterium]|nr:SDR family oxidoreductase [Acidimicrobiia bacterium]